MAATIVETVPRMRAITEWIAKVMVEDYTPGFGFASQGDVQPLVTWAGRRAFDQA